MYRPAQNGYTLVETMVAAVILLILFGGIATVVQISLETIAESRVRSIAAILAQERLELAHNLPYNDVGTVGGIPAGSLPQTEMVTRQGQEFSVTTSVVFIDDPFDDVAPDDTIPTDYKRIRVAVDWEGAYEPLEPLSVWGDIAPKGLETIEGAGTISILVFDSEGAPVSNAEVHIETDDVTPNVDLDTTTDADGRVLLPGALTCIECYEVTVTKDGFSTDRTHGTDEVTNPSKPHLTVLESELSQVSFAIDEVSNLTIQAVRSAEQNYGPWQGVGFRLYGTREIGRTDADEPVYAVDESLSTGINGEVNLPELPWDMYTVEIPSNSIVDFAGSWPFNPFRIRPGQTLRFTMVIVPESPDTLLVQMKDANNAPVASGSVEINHTTQSYIATGAAAEIGNPDQSQVFFENVPSGVYDLIVESLGFAEATASVSVAGNDVESFVLTPEE